MIPSIEPLKNVFISKWIVLNFEISGGGSEVAARALSQPDLNETQSASIPAGLENEERSTMEQEISQISHMIDDMEMKVNVLRWMVEPHGPQYADPLSSTDSTSLALLSVDEEQPGPHSLCQRSQIFVFFLLFAVVLLAATLSISVIFFSWAKLLTQATALAMHSYDVKTCVHYFSLFSNKCCTLQQ